MPPRRSQYLGSWLALTIAVCCRHVAAAAPPNLHVALEYGADPTLGCPSATELTLAVANQLGYDPFTEGSDERRLRIEITKLADRTEARIEWLDHQRQSEGERRLSSDSGDCAELARSLAFAVAVQIQLQAAAGEPPPDATKSAPVPSAQPSRPVAAPAKKALPRADGAEARHSVALGIGAMARHGLTPGVTPGLRLFGALSKKWASLELSAHATLPAELRLGDGTGFTAYELGANLAPCVHLPPVGVCAVGSLGILRVRGQGVDHIGSPSAATGGVGARLQLLWPALERLGVVVQGEALALLAPQDVVLNQTKVWSTAPVALTVILDFAAIFP